MKYDNIFNSPEAIVGQRLAELPGDEGLTMKQAGYNSVWTSFLEEFFQNGWEETVKQASLLDIEDSYDPFVQGQKEAIDTIHAIDEDSFMRGWFSFVKEAHDFNSKGGDVKGFCKEAQLNAPDYIDAEAAGFLAASQNVLESDHDLVEIAWNGPNTTTETEQMNAFELGKTAALNDLLEYASDGASVADCLEVINETVNQELDKNASWEDAQFRLGVETLCYDFLKEAGSVYGTYDTDGVHDDYILDEIFVAVAGGASNPVCEMGKEAALDELVDYALGGYSFEDVLNVVHATIDEPLDKHASEEDVDFQMGIESVCHEFLKEASEMFGSFDTSDATDADLLAYVLEKVAATKWKEMRSKLGPEARSRLDKAVASGQMKDTGDKLKSLQDRGATKLKTDKSGAPTGFGLSEKGKALLGAAKDRKSSRDSSRASAAKKQKMKRYGRNAAMAGAGLAAAGGAAYGAKKLYDKRKEDKEQDKAASYYDPRIANAIAVLDEAGLLDD